LAPSPEKRFVFPTVPLEGEFLFFFFFLPRRTNTQIKKKKKKDLQHPTRSAAAPTDSNNNHHHLIMEVDASASFEITQVKALQGTTYTPPPLLLHTRKSAAHVWPPGRCLGGRGGGANAVAVAAHGGTWWA
jgi:hypothetical protein